MPKTSPGCTLAGSWLGGLGPQGEPRTGGNTDLGAVKPIASFPETFRPEGFKLEGLKASRIEEFILELETEGSKDRRIHI